MDTAKQSDFSDAKDVRWPPMNWDASRSATPLSGANRRTQSSVVTKFSYCAPKPLGVPRCPSMINFFANNYQLITIN
jgi:hypothetical protein